jgi:hypothetical protein
LPIFSSFFTRFSFFTFSSSDVMVGFFAYAVLLWETVAGRT